MTMKGFIKKGLSQGLIAAGKIIPSQGIPILTYHSIDSTSSVISIRQDVFKEQMKYLSDNGYTTISLRQYIDRLRRGKIKNKKEVVLTFDDGFRNNYTFAFPILKKMGFTATFFLTSGFIGRTCQWHRDQSIKEMPLLSWDEIKEMSAADMEFGAHTMNHVDLTKASDIELEQEIDGSRKMIEDFLGKSVDLFCYPYGRYSGKIETKVKNYGFLGSCSIRYGIRNHIQDQYCLRRIGTARFSTQLDFISGVLGTYGMYAGCSDFLRVKEVNFK